MLEEFPAHDWEINHITALDRCLIERDGQQWRQRKVNEHGNSFLQLFELTRSTWAVVDITAHKIDTTTKIV